MLEPRPLGEETAHLHLGIRPGVDAAHHLDDDLVTEDHRGVGLLGAAGACRLSHDRRRQMS